MTFPERPARGTIGRPCHRRWANSLGLPMLACLLVAGLCPATAAPPARTTGCGFTVTVTAQPIAGTVPLVVQFNASASSGVPDLYNWTFGDGSVWSSGSVEAPHPFHRYSSPGTFRAEVEVDEAGCGMTASTNVTAVAGPLSVVILAHPSSGPAPLTVTFNASVLGGTGTYLHAGWNFGDGDLGSGLGVRYTFERSGSFEVTVNVTDSGGHSALQQTRINVTGGNASASTSVGLPTLGTTVVLVVLGIGIVGAIYGVHRRRGLPPDEVPASPGSPMDPERGGLEAGPSVLRAPGDSGSAALSRPTAEPSVGPGAIPSPPAKELTQRARARISERVILHLGAQPGIDADGIATLSRTQGDMASRLGVGQNSLTNVLRRLEAAGVVRAQLRHVRGAPRRLKAYELTPRGESLYRERRVPSPAKPVGPPPAGPGAGTSTTGPAD